MKYYRNYLADYIANLQSDGRYCFTFPELLKPGILSQSAATSALNRMAKQYRTLGILFSCTGVVFRGIGVYNYFKGSSLKEFTTSDIVIDGAGLSLIISGILFEYTSRRFLFKSVEDYNITVTKEE